MSKSNQVDPLNQNGISPIEQELKTTMVRNSYYKCAFCNSLTRTKQRLATTLKMGFRFGTFSHFMGVRGSSARSMETLPLMISWVTIRLKMAASSQSFRERIKWRLKICCWSTHSCSQAISMTIRGSNSATSAKKGTRVNFGNSGWLHSSFCSFSFLPWS